MAAPAPAATARRGNQRVAPGLHEVARAPTPEQEEAWRRVLATFRELGSHDEPFDRGTLCVSVAVKGPLRPVKTLIRRPRAGPGCGPGRRGPSRAAAAAGGPTTDR